MLELLVVMGIMGVMVGITAASYVGVTRRASREGARENVMDILRQARVSAVDTGRGAVVRIDPATNGLYGIATDVIGAWHFEEMDGTAAPYTTPGARRYIGTINGAPTLVAGKLGLAFHFDGANDFVDCGNAPIWNQTSGIRLEAWVRPDSSPDAATPPIPNTSGHILSKTDGTGRGYFLGVDYLDTDSTPGTDSVRFEGGVGFGANGVLLRSLQPFACGQWYQIALEFDGFEARLYVNGVLVDLDSYRSPENAPTNPPGATANPNTDPNTTSPDAWWNPPQYLATTNLPLQIGRGHTDPVNYGYFAGAIDEPRVLSIAGGNPVTLPQMVPMVTSAPAVYYDAQGFLNLAYHTQPVYIAVGDPYQQALLSADTGPTIVLAGASPFPLTGGLVMLGNDVIQYTGVTGGNTLTGLTRKYSPPDNTAVYVGSGPPAGHVYFARVVKVETTGVVEMVTQP